MSNVEGSGESYSSSERIPVSCWPSSVQTGMYVRGLKDPAERGVLMGTSSIRVMVVDDFEPWLNFATKTLRGQPELRVVGEASDGLEAVQKAQVLQPDLILLDIGLPSFNGIQAARRILQYAPKTKILFVSEQRSPDIVEEAFRTGARGYLVKSDSASELLPAVKGLLEGKRFVSASLAGLELADLPASQTAPHPNHDNIVTLPPSAQNVGIARNHEVGFYSNDGQLLDDVTQFIGAALKAGYAAIVVATESHRNSLLSRLQTQGVEMGAAIAEGRYIVLDATDALSTFMVDGTLDPGQFMESFGNLIATAAKAATGEHRRVAFFGEGAHLLWTQGNVDAAIQDERLCNELTRIYEVDFLCGYSVGSVHREMDVHLFQQICAEHSSFRSR